MSWEATNWAVKQLAGSPGAKIVLLLLADRADDKHSCWPSQDRLAQESEQSVATVRRRLRDLEAGGFIWTERRNVPGMKRATNRYFLAVTSSAQSDPQKVSTAQNDDLPLKSDDIYRSQVSAKPPIEPPVEEPSSGFDEFYRAYPRHEAPGAARKAFQTAAKKTDPAVLVSAAVDFRQWCEQERKEKRFIPLPATWLNQERWLDERGPARKTNVEGWMELGQQLWDNDNGSETQNTLQLEG